jgi:hypothetical protein
MSPSPVYIDYLEGVSVDIDEEKITTLTPTPYDQMVDLYIIQYKQQK